MPVHQKGKSGTRKYGRNKVKCANYRIAQSVKNKLAKLKRHMADHPNDNCAIAAKARV